MYENRRVIDAVEKSKNSLSGIQKLFIIVNQYFNSSSMKDEPQNDSDVPLNSTLENHFPPCSRAMMESNLNLFKKNRGLMIGISDMAAIEIKSFRVKDVKKIKLRVCSW